LEFRDSKKSSQDNSAKRMRHEMNARLGSNAFGHRFSNNVDGFFEQLHTGVAVDVADPITTRLETPLQDQHIACATAQSVQQYNGFALRNGVLSRRGT
jgi:ATP-dependent Clp protease ATP-binding subunit ClpA